MFSSSENGIFHESINFNNSSEVVKQMNIPEKIGEYTLYRKIQENSKSVVFGLTDENLVIKCVPKKSFNEDARESLNFKHENVLENIKIIEQPRFVAIVMPRARQDVYMYFFIYNPLPEATVCTIIRSALNGLIYLHENNIWHRDIKLENLLIMKETEKGAHIKIADFGLCKKQSRYDYIISKCVGTLPYAAAELVRKNEQSGISFKTEAEYNCNIDVWSLGVCMFYLLYRRYPFRDADSHINGIIDFTQPKDGIEVSAEANNLIKMMLTTDIHARPAAHELINHEWFELYKPRPNLANQYIQFANDLLRTEIGETTFI